MKDADLSNLGEKLLPAVLDAARIEMAYFGAGVEIERKADKSPVTIADREAEAIIVAALTCVAPQIPIVAEEQISGGHAPKHDGTYFLVDALDGTSGFIRNKPEFTINIGLVRDTRPIFGLIYVPPTGRLFVTRGADAYGATILDAGDTRTVTYRKLKTRTADPGTLIAYNSRTAGGASGKLLAALNVHDARPLGSSMKFGLIAAGEGDIYARFGETHEWDTAAGQAILEAAGGSVTTVAGEPLRYTQGRERYLNPHFIAWGGAPLITGALAQSLAG